MVPMSFIACSFPLFFFLKVTQYSCDYDNLAPQGCTQYFFGNVMDTVQTFNFDGGQHLANQRQAICVRYQSLSYT